MKEYRIIIEDNRTDKFTSTLKQIAEKDILEIEDLELKFRTLHN